MKLLGALLPGIFATMLLSGCVGYSMHSMHPVQVAVTQSASEKPAAGLRLTVVYDYDSYGWFYFFNTPPDETAVTDANGVTIMQLADYRYRILVNLEGMFTSIDKKIILEGGSVNSPSYKLVFAPLAAQPGVREGLR